jgi:hypothetical protein
MILFLLCSALLIPIQINCENPLEIVEIGGKKLPNQENFRYSHRFGKSYDKPSLISLPDDRLINKLARQYLAFKTLEKLNLGDCSVNEIKNLMQLELPFDSDRNYEMLNLWDTANQVQNVYADEPNYVLMRRETDQAALSNELRKY